MRYSLVAISAAAMMVSSVQAGTVTWKESVTSGAWHTGANWDTGVQPEEGDTVFVNNGTQIFWGPSFGGMNSTIRNNSHVTINGGDVQFQGPYHAVIGYGGTGTASSLTVLSGAYRMSGNMNIGNNSGETGTLTIGPDGFFDAGSGASDFIIHPTGTVNSAGTVIDVGNLFLRGGTLNITGGSFTVNGRIDFESSGATGNKVNISGGILTTNNSEANLTLVLGYGDRYFNFLENSTGTLVLPQITVSKLETYVQAGYIRLEGVASPDSLVVSAYGANGSQVSLVPEPTVGALMGLGLAALGLRRRAHA